MQNPVNCLVSKLAFLAISTCQTECLIKIIIHINSTPTTSNMQRRKQKESPGGHWQSPSCPLSKPPLPTDTNGVVGCAQSIRLTSAETKAASYLRRAGRRPLIFTVFSDQSGFVCTGPYASCEGRRAAAVSPQSAGPGAASAPPRCSASRAAPGPGSVERSAGRSHCTRRRCRWDSEEIKNKKRSPLKVPRFNPQTSFFAY